MRIIKPEIKGIYDKTLADKPWTPPGVALIAARKMWATTKGEGSVVAVLDTGIDYNHRDLMGNVIDGISFIPGESNFMDENGHGTHVAGTIAANGKILGVAPEAKLLAVKVLDRNGSGSLSSIIKGLMWVRKWQGANGARVNVINMSLGSSLPNTSIHKEIIAAVKAGITVVCAAGNSGDANLATEEVAYPAYYPETMSVGAVDLLTGIADFSNSNDRIDIVAPGVDTYSAYPEGKYVKLSGTSMAAPHISGAIALIYARYFMRFHQFPSPEYIKNLLHYQAIDLGELGFDNLYGYGFFSFNVDGGKAIRLTVGQRKYSVNNKELNLDSAPFLNEGRVAALIDEICRLLSTDVNIIPSVSETGEPGEVEIWS